MLNNVFDCGITIAAHRPGAVDASGRHPDVAGVYDNTVSGNTANGNGTRGEGGGILIAGGPPGTGAWGNQVIGNTANDNGLGGFTLHSHAPGQDFNDNTISGNSFSHDNLTGDSDAGVQPTTGIIIFSAVSPLHNVVLRGNRISNVHFGIWTKNLPEPSGLLAAANTFIGVDIPVSQN